MAPQIPSAAQVPWRTSMHPWCPGHSAHCWQWARSMLHCDLTRFGAGGGTYPAGSWAAAAQPLAGRKRPRPAELLQEDRAQQGRQQHQAPAGSAAAASIASAAATTEPAASHAGAAASASVDRQASMDRPAGHQQTSAAGQSLGSGQLSADAASEPAASAAAQHAEQQPAAPAAPQTAPHGRSARCNALIMHPCQLSRALDDAQSVQTLA